MLQRILITNCCYPQWKLTATNKLTTVILRCQISRVSSQKIEGAPFLKKCNTIQFHQKRTLPDWAKIVIRLGASLGIGRFLNYTLKRWAPIQRRRKLYKIALYGSVLILTGFYIYAHVEKTPITGRLRFVPLSKESAIIYSNIWEAENKDKRILIDPSKAIYQRPLTILQQLISRNKDHFEVIKDLRLKLCICEDDTMWAFALLNGNIYLGVENTLSLDDDELAFILAHEMTHILLEHSREFHSAYNFLQVLYYVMAATFCAIQPFNDALIASCFYIEVEHFLLILPLSRKCERESDKLAIELVARACYDVTAGARLFKKDLENMKAMNRTEYWGIVKTHPRTEERITNLEELTPQMQELQKSQGCPVVKVGDSAKQAEERQSFILSQ